MVIEWSQGAALKKESTMCIVIAARKPLSTLRTQILNLSAEMEQLRGDWECELALAGHSEAEGELRRQWHSARIYRNMLREEYQKMIRARDAERG